MKPTIILSFFFQLCSFAGISQIRNATSMEIDDFIKKQMDSLHMPGLSIAIIRDSKIIYHRAVGFSNIETKEKVNDESIFEAASLSKPVFSFFVLRMVEKGILELDRPLYFYLPDTTMERDPRYRRVTARMVLCHTTGFPNWRWFDLADSSLHIKTGDFYMKHDPGKIFSYSGEGYHYLARVIAHNNFMNDVELNKLFRQEVGVPLEMKYGWFTWNDFLYDHKVDGHKNRKPTNIVWGSGLPSDNSKVFNAAGSLQTEAVSYAKFLIALMNEQGLKPRSFKEYFKEQVKLPPDHNFRIMEGTTAWGLGIAIQQTSRGIKYSHGGNNGGFQSGFTFYKEQKAGYVFFTNCDKGNEFGKKLEKFLEEKNKVD